MDLAYLGLLEYELQSFDEAKKTLEESLRVASDVGHKKWEAFGHAILGALLADRADVDASTHALDRAHELMRSVNDEEQLVAIDLLEGVLDAARARASATDDAARTRSLDAARARFQRLRTVPAWIATASEVVIASRILAKRVDALERAQSS
jgi:hypothetical protein